MLLLIGECDEWIDVRRAACRYGTRREGHDPEQHRDGPEHEWIERLDAEQMRLHRAPDRERATEADGHAQGEQEHSFAYHQAENPRAIAAEREPDADLASAL